MLKLTRRTPQTLAVLDALLRAEGGEVYAWVVCERTILDTGTVTPILTRLRDGGWLADRWEEASQVNSRPRRRYFRLTDEGRAAAEAELAKQRRHR